MPMRRILISTGLMVWAAVAAAERPVYKNVDDAGRVSYSDRRAGAADHRLKNWMPANPRAYAYDAAVLRAESDREYLARLRAENRQPVPVVVYDPRGWQAARSRPGQAFIGGAPWRGGWDPNLPLSPAPSLEREYYYNGR